jgi:hypothetical protein
MHDLRPTLYVEGAFVLAILTYVVSFVQWSG